MDMLVRLKYRAGVIKFKSQLDTPDFWYATSTLSFKLKGKDDGLYLNCQPDYL